MGRQGEGTLNGRVIQFPQGQNEFRSLPPPWPTSIRALRRISLGYAHSWAMLVSLAPAVHGSPIPRWCRAASRVRLRGRVSDITPVPSSTARLTALAPFGDRETSNMASLSNALRPRYTVVSYCLAEQTSIGGRPMALSLAGTT